MVDANSGKGVAQNMDSKELDERKSDATSDETLSELEENETESDSTDVDPGPSPDGSFDESDEVKDAGPM